MYQISITLKYSAPAIWRRILVDGALSLLRLNHMIQASMGWQNLHRHEFIIGKSHYGYPDPDNFDATALRDSSGVTVAHSLKIGKPCTYIYDFGDGWEHEIVVEEILSHGRAKPPACLDGARACPPEDCGGMPGYEHMLGILTNPLYAEYAEVQRWLGKEFDPEEFCPAAATRRMRSPRWQNMP